MLAGDDQAHFEDCEAAEDGQLTWSPKLGQYVFEVRLGQIDAFRHFGHQDEHELKRGLNHKKLNDSGSRKGFFKFGTANYATHLFHWVKIKPVDVSPVLDIQLYC